jgi:hypothetical protein
MTRTPGGFNSKRKEKNNAMWEGMATSAAAAMNMDEASRIH